MAINLSLNLKKDVLGVDLGQNCIKVIKVSKSRAGSVAEELVLAETGFDPNLPAGEFQRKRSQILASIWKEHRFKARNVMLSAPGRGALVRQLRIPRVTGERLDRIVRFEAKQQIPFPLDQVILDYHVFDTGEPELEVTLIAIRQNAIEDQVRILREARLRPDTIDISSLCLFNALSEREFDPEAVVGLIDIGASETNIIIQQDHIVKFIRSAPVGGNLLTQAIADKLDISFTEAEELKLSVGGLETSSHSTGPTIGRSIEKLEEISEVLREGVDKIFSEIRLSIDFYISQPDGMALTEVLLTGGTTRLEGIDEMLEERLGIPAEKIQPFDLTGLDTQKVHAEGIEEVSAVALGLGMRGTDQAIAEMNFIPSSVRESKAIRSRIASMVVQTLLLCLTIGVICFYLYGELDKHSAANEYLVSILGGGERLGREAQKLLAEREKMDSRFDTLENIMEQRGRLANQVLEIAKVAPPEVWIINLTAGARSFKLTGRCDYKQATKIKDFLANLNMDPYFQNVSLVDERPVGDYQEFEISIGKLVRPNPEDLLLVEVLLEKELDVLYAQRVILDKPTPGYVLVNVAMLGADDRDINDKQLPKIVDAMISSGLKFDRVDLTWRNHLRKKIYIQRCKHEYCQELQSGNIDLEVFAKEKIRTVIATPEQESN